jgi:hypothetical protein
MNIDPIKSPIGTAYAAKSTSSRETMAQPTNMPTGEVRISSLAAALAKANGSDDSAAKAVMAHYDLRHITYTDLVVMAGELRDAGALKAEDYLDFIGPSPEFGSLSGERVADWNAAKDYVGLHEQQVAFMRESGAEQRFIDFAEYHLALYRHFESLQSSAS